MRQLKQFVPVHPGSAGWYRDGSGPRISTFDEDRASRNARALAGKKARSEARDLRRSKLKQMLQWTSSRPKDDSYAEKYRHRLHEWLSLFSSLPRDAREAALDGQQVLVPYHQLSKSAQEGLVRITLSPQVPKEMVIEMCPGGTPAAPGMSITLRKWPGGGEVIQDVLNQPKLLADGWTWQHHHQGYQERDRGPLGRQKIPELQQSLTIDETLVEQVLEELAGKAGLPLLAEYDPCYGNPYRYPHRSQKVLNPGKVRGVPAWQALDIVCREFDLDWDFHEGWVRIRSPRTVLVWAGLLDLSPPDQN